MRNNNRYNVDDPPSPSIRHKFTRGFIRRFSSPQFLSQSCESEEKDKIVERRLKNLNMDKAKDEMETLSSLEERTKMLTVDAESQNTPSVTEIEHRLARLDDLPVENIRYPRSTVLNRNEKETVEKLIRRAKDEVVLENEWNRPGKSKDMHDVDPEKFLKIYKSHSSFPDELNGEILTSDADVTMGQDTIRNLKQIQQTMKLARQQSLQAAKLKKKSNDNHSMDYELKKFTRLTNQSKIKSEEINDELSKFWATRLYDEMSSYESSFKSENLDNEAEVDDDELQRVILEAEEENEAMQKLKESKKNRKKNGLLSRIFRHR